MTTLEVLLDGLFFPEGPRWHEDRIWFSDMHAGKVMAANLNGELETIASVPGQPSGLGWLPDGRLLIVSMLDRRLLRLDPAGLTLVADLYDMASYHCNDMVVDDLGRAYIGNFGFDLVDNEPRRPAELILVEPDGQARVVAHDLLFPNGMVITPDRKTLIVAETWGTRLTAFDIEPDGSLSNRRVWAQLAQNLYPDGICLDAENAVWAASPSSAEVIRVLEGGEVTHRIPVSTNAYACMLGGPGRRTLFVLTSGSHDPGLTVGQIVGRIETVQVDVPGAGLP